MGGEFSRPCAAGVGGGPPGPWARVTPVDAAFHLVGLSPARPRIAIRTDLSRGCAAGALDAMPTSTLRGDLFRKAAACSIRLGARRLLSVHRLEQLWAAPECSYRQWLDGARLGADEVIVSARWSPSRGSARMYLKTYDRTTGARRFIKVGFGDEARAVEREARVLAAIGKLPEVDYGVAVRAPEQRWSTPGSSSLVFAALPRRARPLGVRESGLPERVVRDIRRGTRHYRAVDELARHAEWDVDDPITRAVLAAVERECPGEPVECAYVHGDIGPTNFLRDAGTVWLVDWEEGTTSAPALTDSLGLELSFGGRPAIARRRARLAREIADPASLRRHVPVLLALVHRHSYGHVDATAILRGLTTRGLNPRD